MRICPECGCQKIKENGEIVCTGCGLVLREQDVATQRTQDNFNMADRNWEDPKTPIQRYDRWVFTQKDIAKKLGIHHNPETTQFLSRKRCTICGKPANKYAKMALCPEHAAERRRAYLRFAKQKERKQKGK